MATATLAGTRAPARGTNALRRGEDEAPGDDDQGDRRLAGADGSWASGTVAAGPVLPGATARRGGLCRGRSVGPDHAAGRLGRPAAGAGSRKGSWSEIARGSARKLIKTVASDTKGTFHGLGALDKALRRAGKGLERLPVKREGKTVVYAESGEACSAQEALFHYFGLPLHVLVEPSEWYSYHRKPMIVEGARTGPGCWCGSGR